MIGEICTKPVVTVSPGATVREAAELMRRKHVGAVVVTNAGMPKGMLTDRDIATRVVAEDRDPSKTRVSEVMHANPTVLSEDQGVFDAAKMFSSKAVRRLPVVDKRGEVIGIVSLDDLLMLLGSEMGHVATALAKELGRPIAA
ncbi:MAG: CBS domain-containing protein [Candidatus Rokubacteria bacterium]|nr:CBS domain-containing protein [Candidatus Rokubacteria bacterium]